MNNAFLKTKFFGTICLTLLLLSTAGYAKADMQVQTNSATNVQNNQVTLNGNLVDANIFGYNYVYFQYGTDTNYGNITAQQTLSSSVPFSQIVSNLLSNTTYHFRAAVNGNNGTTYGQDMTFTTGQYNNNYNNGNFSVQTNYPTYVQNNSAILNGTLYGSTSSNVWFQWGTDTNYGSTSFQQSLSSGQFMQQIANLNNNTTYHFRAVAQANNGQTIYGQDMSFNTNGSTIYNGNNNTGTLSVTKQVMNLSSGNLNWSTSASASPGDVLNFAVILHATGGQDIHNVFIRDIMPANLIYKGSVTLNNAASSLDVTSGVNIGTIPAGGTQIVSYQAQVAPSTGISTLTNNATVTSTEAGTQTTSASVTVNNIAPSGPTYIPTGLTNNPVTDSFFWPILLIIMGSWFYFSGNIYKFSDWLESKTLRQAQGK